MEFQVSQFQVSRPAAPRPPGSVPDQGGAAMRGAIASLAAERARAELLARAAELCKLSYVWSDKGWNDATRAERTHERPFPRQPARLRWRLDPFVLLPFNYVVALLFGLLLLGLFIGLPLLLVAGFPAMYLLYSPALWELIAAWSGSVLYWAVMVFAAAGGTVALVIAIRPGCASGRAYGFVDARTGSPTLVFCGSSLFDNLAINGLVLPCFRPLRHLGFQRAWRCIAPGVEDWLRELGPDHGELVLTGHSLGGALAQIAALELAPRHPIRAVISFGSSRIGGAACREAYAACRDARDRSLFERSLHIVHQEDLIPRIPPIGVFSHAGAGYALAGSGSLRADARKETIVESLLVRPHDPVAAALRAAGAARRQPSFLNVLGDTAKTMFGAPALDMLRGGGALLASGDHGVARYLAALRRRRDVLERLQESAPADAIGRDDLEATLDGRRPLGLQPA